MSNSHTTFTTRCEEDPTAEGCEDLEPIEDPDEGGDGDEGGEAEG
jgi:hypothetical protein